MPIIELAALQLLPPHEFHSPHILELFRAINTRQSAVSNFPLYFFEDATDKSIIYLTSGWDDVGSHMNWIESDTNQDLLRLSAPYLKVLRLFHLDVNFTGTEVRDATVVVVRKSGKETTDKLDYVQDTPTWTGVGIDLESGPEGTKYEVFAYDNDTRRVPGVSHAQIGGQNHTMIMVRLALSEGNRVSTIC